MFAYIISHVLPRMVAFGPVPSSQHRALRCHNNEVNASPWTPLWIPTMERRYMELLLGAQGLRWIPWPVGKGVAFFVGFVPVFLVLGWNNLEICGGFLVVGDFFFWSGGARKAKTNSVFFWGGGGGRDGVGVVVLNHNFLGGEQKIMVSLKSFLKWCLQGGYTKSWTSKGGWLTILLVKVTVWCVVSLTKMRVW